MGELLLGWSGSYADPPEKKGGVDRSILPRFEN